MSVMLLLLYTNRYKAFQEFKPEEGQGRLDEYFTEEPFKPRNAKQLTIKKCIMDYIIGCAIPLSHVDDPSFRRMISACENKFSHFTRYDHSTRLSEKSSVSFFITESKLVAR